MNKKLIKIALLISAILLIILFIVLLVYNLADEETRIEWKHEEDIYNRRG